MQIVLCTGILFAVAAPQAMAQRLQHRWPTMAEHGAGLQASQVHSDPASYLGSRPEATQQTRVSYSEVLGASALGSVLGAAALGGTVGLFAWGVSDRSSSTAQPWAVGGAIAGAAGGAPAFLERKLSHMANPPSSRTLTMAAMPSTLLGMWVWNEIGGDILKDDLDDDWYVGAAAGLVTHVLTFSLAAFGLANM